MARTFSQLDSSSHRASRGLGFSVVAGALAAAGAALALLLAGTESFWIDEVSSVGIAGRATPDPFFLLAYVGAADVHPPAYYLLLAGWGALFGWGELALRMLSALAAACAVWGTARLGRRAFGEGPGLAAAAVLVLLPCVRHYAVEVRMYALLLALVVGTANAALDVASDRRARNATLRLTLVLAVGLYTAYVFAAFAVAIVGVAALVGARTRRARVRLVGAVWWAAVLFAPWLPSFLYQLTDLPAGFTAHLALGPSAAALVEALGPGAGLASATGRQVSGFAWVGLFVLGTVLVLALRRRGRPASGVVADSWPLRHVVSLRVVLPVLLGLGAATLGALALIAALPLPEGLAALHRERLLFVPAFPIVAAGGALALSWLGGRLRVVHAEQGTIIAWTAVVAVLALGALALARSAAMVRTVLPLLPFATILITGGADRVAGARALAPLTLCLLAVSAASLTGGAHRVAPRPDLRSVARALESGENAEAPVLVLPRWEISGLLHYAPQLSLLPIDRVEELVPALRRSPRVRLLLGRRDAVLWALHRERLGAVLAGVGEVCGEPGMARGFRWWTLCRLSGPRR